MSEFFFHSPTKFQYIYIYIYIQTIFIYIVVKVDDTTSGIVAGLNAGCWTVGVAKTGNYVGMTEAEMEKCDTVQLEKKIENARNILYKSGAHFVIETTNELPEVIEEINKRMKMGLKP